MVEKKMALPEKNADCLAYQEIDKTLLKALCTLEYFNEQKLKMFWEMNLHERT